MNRGLIEAAAESACSFAGVILPRFMNRGLIEAYGICVACGQVASLPRFMNRGLIEAQQLLPSPATALDFPDS